MYSRRISMQLQIEKTEMNILQKEWEKSVFTFKDKC